MEAVAANPPTALPPLREELSIEPGAAGRDGAPTWLIHDPLRNRFFRIGEKAFRLLTRWKPESGLLIADGTQSDEAEELERLCRFLYANSLTRIPAKGGYQSYLVQEEAGRKPWYSKLVHNYLFFRIHLFRPQRLLNVGWAYVQPLFSQAAAVLLFILGLLSMFLIARQWETFATTFASFLSFEGFALYALSLIFLKFLHEFGHAFMAKKYGVDVSSIGVAFLVLMPVLYTDTSAAARLKDPRQRLMIGGAGMFTELAAAVFFSLLWVFLPDGPMRSIAFATATVSWVLSLTINLNPFMRFDGYYILSDLIGIENLQHRGFELARWWLRERLFAPDEPPPEHFNPAMRAFLICHAIGTWIYRFFLFLGIAILVYHFFIKLIGILLFVIEIVWFILLPIVRELHHWWDQRTRYARTRRSRITALVALVFAALMCIPWSGRVHVPAVLSADQEFYLFAPEPGVLAASHLEPGRKILAGEPLIKLEAPELDALLNNSRTRLQVLQLRVNRLGSDPLERPLLQVAIQELAAEKARLSGLQNRKENLLVHAPFNGLIVDVDPELHPGQWVGGKRQLAVVRSLNGIHVKGVVEAADRARLSDDAEGTFLPEDPSLPKLKVRFTQLADVSVRMLPEEMLADIHGGRVPTLPADASDNGELAPLQTWFELELAVANPQENFVPSQVIRGTAVLSGEARSFASRIFTQVASVLIRESGF